MSCLQRALQGICRYALLVAHVNGCVHHSTGSVRGLKEATHQLHAAHRPCSGGTAGYTANFSVNVHVSSSNIWKVASTALLQH